ncbi:hypothetical protein IE53DRAFT_84519 [Violaceomyces palustris]|uniref:Uncharacterized protein n=1 Tax=Violaceomyces palustris TaxID=1673888 RepID=A0ACD0P7E5_9BASI|nr:hypothetical protein IE53DRAFT_84519 [Violaceomyces palustris]
MPVQGPPAFPFFFSFFFGRPFGDHIIKVGPGQLRRPPFSCYPLASSSLSNPSILPSPFPPTISNPLPSDRPKGFGFMEQAPSKQRRYSWRTAARIRGRGGGAAIRSELSLPWEAKKSPPPPHILYNTYTHPSSPYLVFQTASAPPSLCHRRKETGGGRRSTTKGVNAANLPVRFYR